MKKVKGKGAKSQNLGSPHGPPQTLHRSMDEAFMQKRMGWYSKKRKPMPDMGMGMMFYK